MKRCTPYLFSTIVLLLLTAGQAFTQPKDQFFNTLSYASKGVEDARESRFAADERSAYIPPGEFIVLDFGEGRYFSDGPREDLVVFIRGSERPRIIVEARDPSTKEWHELHRLMSPDPYGNDEHGLALEGCEFYDMKIGLIGFSRLIRIRNVSMNSNVFIDAVWARYTD